MTTLLTFVSKPTKSDRYLLLRDPQHSLTSAGADFVVQGWTLIGVSAHYWPESSVALVSVNVLIPPEPGSAWALRETQPVEDALELAYWQFKEGKNLPETERDRFKAVVRPLLFK